MTTLSLLEAVAKRWQANGRSRSAPVHSELQEIILASIGGELDSLRQANARLAARVDRLERKVKRIDPEGAGGTIIGHEG